MIHVMLFFATYCETASISYDTVRFYYQVLNISERISYGCVCCVSTYS